MPHAKLAVIAGCLLLLVTFFAFTGTRNTAIAADAPDGDKKAAATFEVYKDKGGQFRWRLRMKNTKVIASSGEGYKEKDSCLKAIESVKRVVADAPVKEVEATDATKGEAEGGNTANQ